MIIGKSLTTLGGGGLKPEIIVTAKAGALLNLHYKNSSIILQSYRLGANEAQHTFVVNVSETAYVVKDTTNGKNVEVLVDAVCQYSVKIPYTIMLYDTGNEYTDVTGGWSACQETAGSGTFTKNSTNMYAKSATASYGAVGGGTSNKIDVTNFSKLYVVVTSYVDNYNMYNFGIGLSSVLTNTRYDNNPGGSSGFPKSVMTSFPYTCVHDLSNTSGKYHIVWYVPWRGQSATVTKVWLE